MRCHVSLSTSSAAAAADIAEKLDLSRGYGLRENPKKTWRLSNHAKGTAIEEGSDDKKRYCCRECGKEFQSCKALFGHMKSHSYKSAESLTDDDPAAAAGGGPNVGGPKKKRRSGRAGSASSSADAEPYYSKEQADGAITLMMLSRDLGYWTNGFTDSSHKNSVVLEGCPDFDEEDSDDSVKKQRIGSDGIHSELGRSSMFECITCNKSFHSYQALGGHRASHKRVRGCFSANGPESDGTPPIYQDQAVGNSQHQCLICGKVFASGQALGGHKRSHLVPAGPIVTIQNFNGSNDDGEGASMDEDSSKGSVSIAAAVGVADYRSWWAGSNALQSEAFVSLIAN